MHRVLCLTALVVAFILSMGATANAAPTLSDVKAEPVSKQAGAHSPFDLSFKLNGLGDRDSDDYPTNGDGLRHLRIALPAGLLGAITSAEECSVADMRQNACAANTRLGTVSTDVSFLLFANPDSGRAKVTSEPVQVRAFGQVVRAPVRGSEPARLGIVLIPKLCVPVTANCDNPVVSGVPIVLESEISVRTATDGGLTAVVRDIPRNVPLTDGGFYDLDIAIETMNLRLDAASGSGKAFMTNPTTCGPATTELTATTYAGVSLTATPSFTPTGCDTVPFDPTVQFTSSAAGADLPTEGAVIVGLPYSDNPASIAQTQPKTAVVKLPRGFELSPSIGSGGLDGCTDAQFAKNSTGPSSCPAQSQIGSVVFSSPLIADPVPGKVFLAQPTPGGPPLRIFIVAELSGAEDALRIKLAGVSDPDPETGQVTTTLTDIPPLTFSTFRLTFRGGDHAVFSTPRTCGTYTTTATFTPHSGGAAASPSSALDVAGDCPDPNAFSPTATLATSPNQAGSYSPMTAVIQRPDRQARLRALKLAMPPGLLGKIPGVPQCDLDAARAGACPEDSRVGTVTALAGPGAAPLSVSGPMYLTPGIDGSFAGLAIVVPAKVGPIDLGNTVTLAKLSVRPADQGLDVSTEAIPLRQAGVAFSLRSLKLDLDRPGFTLAPTSCAAMPVIGDFTSDLGGSGSSETTYQAEGCANLPFGPKIAAKLGGSRAEVNTEGHPSFQADVSQDSGQADMSSVTVTLPAGVSTDPLALAGACKATAFAEGACPDAATVGTARAETPLLDTPLEGKVIFVAQPVGGLPDLKVQLRGQLSVDLTGKVRIAPNGQLITEFQGIPDVPITRFGLTIAGGRRGLLVATRDMCTSGPKLAASFTAHSGARSSSNGPVTVENCSAVGTLRITALSKGRPSARLRVDGAGRKVTTTRLTLPSGLTLDTRRARRLIRVQAAGMKKGAKATLRVRRNRIDVTLPKGGASKATITLQRGALRVTKKLRTKRRPQLAFKLRITQPGLRSALNSTLRTRPVPRL